jgi:hypothetical protein
LARHTWQNPAYFSRCHGKTRYRSIVSAALAADKASTKTGELILAYACPDCGGAHIGHPEPTELLLRDNQVFPTCLNCDKEIPPERRRRAAAVAMIRSTVRRRVVAPSTSGAVRKNKSRYLPC